MLKEVLKERLIDLITNEISLNIKLLYEKYYDFIMKKMLSFIPPYTTDIYKICMLKTSYKLI